jgi:hypothetical protein
MLCGDSGFALALPDFTLIATPLPLPLRLQPLHTRAQTTPRSHYTSSPSGQNLSKGFGITTLPSLPTPRGDWILVTSPAKPMSPHLIKDWLNDPDGAGDNELTQFAQVPRKINGEIPQEAGHWLSVNMFGSECFCISERVVGYADLYMDYGLRVDGMGIIAQLFFLLTKGRNARFLKT